MNNPKQNELAFKSKGICWIFIRLIMITNRSKSDTATATRLRKKYCKLCKERGCQNEKVDNQFTRSNTVKL